MMMIRCVMMSKNQNDFFQKASHFSCSLITDDDDARDATRAQESATDAV